MSQEPTNNTATVNQTVDEVNPKLIDLVSQQITALNHTIVKFIITMIITTILIVVLSVSNGVLMYVIYFKVDKVEHDNSLTKKHIWELKRALELEFSHERSPKDNT